MRPPLLEGEETEELGPVEREMLGADGAKERLGDGAGTDRNDPDGGGAKLRGLDLGAGVGTDRAEGSGVTNLGVDWIGGAERVGVENREPGAE